MIKIYTAPNCPNCVKVKALLRERNKDFEEVNIAGKIDVIRMLKEKTGIAGVPVTEVNDQLIVGWDEERLKKELE